RRSTRMTPTLVACGLLVGTLLLCVVATMALENWQRWRVRLVASHPEPSAEPSAVPSPSSVDPEPERPQPAEVVHVLPGRERADQLVGALFAAYAAARLPEAGRAAAWVTAGGRPPGEQGREFEPGVDLRNKPAAAARLLDCDVDGRTWVTLNTSVDIGRGLARRPPRCATLDGLTSWWAATRAAVTRVPDDSLAPLRAAIVTLEPHWRDTTVAAQVRPLLAALDEAIDTPAPLLVQVPLAPFGDRRDEQATVGLSRPFTPVGTPTV
ncbi:MAG: hypothetical protein ACYC2O_08315, partial [Microthrixaceae bacterium]